MILHRIDKIEEAVRIRQKSTGTHILRQPGVPANHAH